MNAAPIPKDIQDFQFKHASTQHLCDNLEHVPVTCSLIVADGKRGLLYIAYERRLTILQYNGDTNNQCAIDYDLPYPISKLSMSCDFSYLGVTFNKTTAYVYNASLLSKNTLEILHEVQLSSSNSNVFGYDLRWNPTVSGLFCTVASDHTIGCFQIKEEQKTTVRLVAMEKISGLDAMCVAWSPKGKQLVIGCKNGNIVQLKPELKIARTIPGPSSAIGEIIAILWISNYQFCAAYSNPNERRVNVLVVNAPKGETVANFMCYDDITYGMPDMEGDYLPRYYFDHVPEWNLIIASSSSSSEVAVLGSLDNGANWEQWQLIDSARAQLPLIRTVETYPVGMTIDKSSVNKLPWGPENTLPNPVPILHIFGTSGQIISFHMVNLQPNCPSICSPPSEPTIITNPPQLSLITSEISFNTQSAITSTPRPKQIESGMEKPKIVPNTHLFNYPPSIANIVSTAPPIPPPITSVTQTNVTLSAPVTHVDLKIPKPRSEKVEVSPLQKANPPRLSPAKEISTATSRSETPIIDDSICGRAYQEELIHFERELKSKLEPQVWQVGTEEERQRLIIQCAEIDEFWRELRETTNSLSSEIAYLKALLLQSFAWVEETKSRTSANDSEISRDRHDRSKIQELQRLSTHTQSQLIQAMKALDMQWSEYQSQERSKMKIPNLEFVYQGLKKHAEIIARQKKHIDQLFTELRTVNIGNKISDLNRSISELNLNVKTSKTSFSLNGNGGIIETRCRIIATDTKNFNREKQLKLRNILLNKGLKIIKPIIPTPVQDRLEATLSSLASLNPVPVASKVKIGKFIPEHTVVTKPCQIITTTTTTVIPVQKKTSTSQSPLSSLTTIVANIGSPASETAVQPPPQLKSQPSTFSMSSFPSIFSTISATEKNHMPPYTSFNLKLNTPNQPTNIPPLSLPSTTQPSAGTTTFPKVMTISFGMPDQKVSEIGKPANIAPKEIPEKNIPTSKFKDNQALCTQPLFDTNLFATSANTRSSTSKNDPPSTYHNQIVTSLGSSLSLSFKDNAPQVITNQQSVFSFASPSSAIVPPKTTVATSLPSPENIQNFSFVSKPLNITTSSQTNNECVSIKSAIRENLGVSKINEGISIPKATEKLPTSNVISSTSTANAFGKLSTSVSTTINFGKALSLTSSTSQTEQENKSVIMLPTGTTIEKVGGLTGTFGTTNSSTSIFSGNSTTTSNMFGGSTFSGTSMSSALSQITSSSIATEIPTVTTTTSNINSPSNNVFSQITVTSSNAPMSPTFSNTIFSNTSADQTKNINFGKLQQTPEASTVFGKNIAIAVPSAAATTSPFIQTASSPLSVSNLTKTPSTSSSISFFSNNANSSSNSIFGGTTGATTDSSKIFGGNSGSSARPSLFNSGPASTAALPTGSLFGDPVFGSTPFGAQSPMPVASPVPACDEASFPVKPVFGGQSSLFGTAKPEFSSPFGLGGFGSSPGFGSAPTMTASPPAFSNTQMDKVFGSPAGSTTFESLAGQNTQLTFDSLAQKSPSPEKPPSFSCSSSFSSWR